MGHQRSLQAHRFRPLTAAFAEPILEMLLSVAAAASALCGSAAVARVPVAPRMAVGESFWSEVAIYDAEAENKVTELQARIGGLESTVCALQADLEEQQAEVAATKARAAVFELRAATEKAAVEAEAAAARAETAQLVEAVAALQAEAAVATRVVETLTDNLERSQDRVRATEARAPLEPKPAQLPA